MGERGHSRRRVGLWAAVAAAGVVLLGAGALALLLRDTATPASIDDALARFRAEAERGATPAPEGVYTYATTGSESIDALGGVTHEYPASSTITVTADPCGMQLRWDVLKERSTAWTVCDDGDQGELRLAGWTERHVFFGQDDSTTWACSSSLWLGDPEVADPSTPHRCDGGDTVQEGTVEIVGVEPVTVGDASVDAVHVRLEADEDGSATGPLREDRWLEPDTGLPLQLRYEVVTANASPIGDVEFRESIQLVLDSLEPRR